MNKYLRILAPSIVGVIVTVFVLIFSGLATSTILNSEGQTVTNTIVALDVNVFAAVILLSVFLSVALTGYFLNRK